MQFHYSNSEAYVEEWYNVETDEYEPCEPRYDELLDESNWEFFTDGLTEVLQRMNPGQVNLRVEVANFGWRNLSGYKDLGDVDNADDFISAALPNCDWRFEGQWDEKDDFFTFTLWHHDSPTGESWRCEIHDLTCRTCGGEGWLVDDTECPICEGSGEEV